MQAVSPAPSGGASGPMRRGAVLLPLLMMLAALVGFGYLPAQAGKETVPGTTLLKRFDHLSPAQRWERLGKAGNAAKECERVVRGDLKHTTIVARGALESARMGSVICTVRAQKGTTTAGIVQWLVDAGERVKKGDLVIQLDASARIEALAKQKRQLAQACADLAKIRDQFELVRMGNDINFLSCAIDFRNAQLALKKYGGKDKDVAGILTLRAERAKLAMARAQVFARSQLALAQPAVDTKNADVVKQTARVRELEEQIKACRMVAPQDGIVRYYYVPEGTTIGSDALRMVVAQGEPVREGQHLLDIPDLTQMRVRIRLQGPLVSALRGEDYKGKTGPQKAQIRVDAYPNHLLKGHVKAVDTSAEPTSTFDPRFDDGPYFRAQVSVDDKLEGLKPGMSAEVTINTGRAADVLYVPLSAVVRTGQHESCYTERGKGIYKVAVVSGLRSDARVELRLGLKEGDMVLRDPVGLLRRLQP